SSVNGGSNTARLPTVWRKPAIGCSRLHNYRRANGAARERRTRSNDCTRNLSAGSKRRPCCHQQRLPPCCSGRSLPPVKSTCARSMAGKRLPRPPSISQLTSPPEPITSCRWRLRHIEFQHKARRHLFSSRNLNKERKRGAQQFRDCFSVFRSIFDLLINYPA